MTSPIVIRCASCGHSALPSGRVHGTSVVPSRADNARPPGRSVSCRQRKSIASSITLSARPSKESGNVTPSALAVFRFPIEATREPSRSGKDILEVLEPARS
jgi:hypothetical protein